MCHWKPHTDPNHAEGQPETLDTAGPLCPGNLWRAGWGTQKPLRLIKSYVHFIPGSIPLLYSCSLPRGKTPFWSLVLARISEGIRTSRIKSRCDFPTNFSSCCTGCWTGPAPVPVHSNTRFPWVPKSSEVPQGSYCEATVEQHEALPINLWHKCKGYWRNQCSPSWVKSDIK